jgi:hypothetical protein
MIRTGTLEQALGNRRKLTLANGTGYWKSEFIVSAPEARPGPQAFLIEQDPDTVIEPHFHMENEFQVVVRGHGMFGRHPVRPFTVHYAGAHTGYGPIAAGAEGLWYFTLRPVMDAGAHFLPESRDRMKRIPKRHLLGQPVEASPGSELARLPAPVVDAVLEPQPDGIAAWTLRAPPGASAQAPQHEGGGGLFCLVIAGGQRHAGNVLPMLATSFIAAEESGFTILAGPEGLEMLLMQFPQEASP